MVFYRKYRPQNIADLDNALVRERLTAALSGANVPHAFLFTGPKGLGKTSTARIVAKVVNCENNSKLKTQNSKLQLKAQNFENIEPCNKCNQCISITNGTNLDVLEIDGASNRGIDEIRSLQEKIGLAPFGAKKKVYIIDEVHMLTTEAFNALLKTLEEPPSHALFILCTTESHKVPATIGSRCFQIAFSRATVEELVRSFKRVLQGETLEADDESLEVIAKFSDGSFRDGAKALEEVVGLAKGKKITREMVEKKYLVSSIKYQVDGLLKVLSQKDTKAGLQVVEALVESGIDIKYFIEQCIDELHLQLLVRVGVKNSKLQGDLNIEEIKKLVELLSKAHGEIKYAVLPQLPLELVIVEYTLSQSVPSVSTEVKEEKLEDRNFWFAFLDAVKKENHTIAGVLRGCHMVRYDEKEAVIETKYKFHKEKLEEEKAIKILEKAGKEVTGNSIKVLVVLRGR